MLAIFATDEISSVDSNGCQVSGFNTQVGSHTLRFTAKDNAGNEVPEQPPPISYRIIEQPVVEAITPLEGEEWEEQEELHYD